MEGAQPVNALRTETARYTKAIKDAGIKPA